MNLASKVITESELRAPRFELKYKFLYASEIQDVFDDLGVVSQYPDRIVNTLYLDTLQHDFFNCGKQKAKVRIRWYNDSKDKSYLEFKTKVNGLSFKKIYDLPYFDQFSHDIFKDFKRPMQAMLGTLEPVFQISYNRQYFYLPSTGTRFTIDSAITYDALTLEYSLLEVKYPYEDFKILNKLQTVIDRQPVSHSKFSIGTKLRRQIITNEEGWDEYC